MSKIIVTVTGSSAAPLDDEAVETIKEDCEDLLRAMGASGVDVEVEVLP